jgi:hypothetical protein
MHCFLSLLCLHQLSPGNSSQHRFLSFCVLWLRSLLDCAYLTTQLGVAWLQSSIKGYSSRHYNSRTDCTALPMASSPGPRTSCLQTHCLQTNSKLQSALLIQHLGRPHRKHFLQLLYSWVTQLLAWTA